MLDPTVANLQEQVLAAARGGQSLEIRGSGSKAFYGREPAGQVLSPVVHAGIIDYQPAELVMTARAGTALAEIRKTLAENGQMLGFDPPMFDSAGTLGGAVAAALSGPSRPYLGSVQDFVLGCQMLTGEGKVMRFGGKVIKNVAGFDVSRLMAGSLGCLGVILEISMKVVPLPKSQKTVAFEQPMGQAIQFMNTIAGRPLPLTAACWYDGKTRMRFSGSSAGVDAAIAEIGGDLDDSGSNFWDATRDHTYPFFSQPGRLLKASVTPATPGFDDETAQLIEWGGARRWAWGQDSEEAFSTQVRAHGGHVTVFRGGDRSGEVFPPLDPAVMKIHQRLKTQFDPKRIFNPGRMYGNL